MLYAALLDPSLKYVSTSIFPSLFACIFLVMTGLVISGHSFPTGALRYAVLHIVETSIHAQLHLILHKVQSAFLPVYTLIYVV
jgi:predicted small integral membrane protein